MKDLGKNSAVASSKEADELGGLVDQASEDILDGQLQSYARKVAMLCALEAGGKVSPLEAYKRIKHEWKQLKSLKREMFPKDKGAVS